MPVVATTNSLNGLDYTDSSKEAARKSTQHENRRSTKIDVAEPTKCYELALDRSYPEIAMELAVEKRIHRVIQVLLHIESGPRFNARTLADIFGVKRRTIYRDIAILRNVGFVITFDETVDAYVLTSPKSPPYNFNLSADDLEMLAVAAKLAASALSPRQFHRVESALARLMACFPLDTRIQVNQLFNSLHSAADEAATPDNDPVWQLMVHAIRNRLQVRITLHGTEPIQTKIDPYQLIATGMGWKVVGRSSLHRATKTYALTDIAAGEITEDSFIPPRGAHRMTDAEST